MAKEIMEVTFFSFSPKLLLWLFWRVLGEGQGNALVPVTVLWEGGSSGSMGTAGMSSPLLLCFHTGMYLPAPEFAFAWDRSTVMEGL